MTKELKGLFPEEDNNQLKIHEQTIGGYKIATLKLSADADILEGEALKDRLKELVDLLISKSLEASLKGAKLYHIIDLRNLLLLNTIMRPGLINEIGVLSLRTQAVQNRMGIQIIVVEKDNHAIDVLSGLFTTMKSTKLHFVETPEKASTLMHKLIEENLDKSDIESNEEGEQ